MRLPHFDPLPWRAVCPDDVLRLVFPLGPTFLGGPAGYIIVSGHSMEPTYYTGDLVLTHKKSSYAIGDVVAYKAPENKGNIIHRIVGGDAESGFVMQGDNNSFQDPSHPTASTIVGAKWLEFDGAGKKLQDLRQPPMFATMAAFMAGFAIFTNKEIKKKRTRGRQMRHHGQDSGGGSGSGGGVLAAPAWALAGLGVAVLFLAVFTALTFTALRRHPAKLITDDLGSYQDTGTFSYSILTLPSTLYPSGVVGPMLPPAAGAPDAPPPPAYTRQAKQMALDFAFELTSKDPQAVHGELSADLIIRASGDGGWTKAQNLLPATPFDGAKAAGHFNIDFTSIGSLIETIEKETGFTPASYDLVVVPTVHVTGNVGSKSIDEKYAPQFTVKYSKTTITPDASLRRSEPHSVTATRPVEQHVGLLVISPRVPAARVIFGALTLLALGVAGAFAAVVFLGIGQDERTRLARPLRHEVRPGDRRGLLRLSARPGRPPRGPGDPGPARRPHRVQSDAR